MTINQETEPVQDQPLVPGVSVVVCCHDSADVIEPTLRALAGQIVPAGSGCEVVLVDNNCTDGTVTLAREVWKQAEAKHPLRVVTEEMPGLIHARKRGAAHARHDILFFIDDDNIVADDALPELLSLYHRHPQAAAIGGRIEPLFQGEKPPWFDLVPGAFACTPMGPGADQPGIRLTMSGAGLSFRTRFLRSIFTSSLPLFLVGRKNEALSRGEDAEICLRLALQGSELRYEPSLRVRHLLRRDRLNWEYVLEARRWFGKAEVVLRMYKDVLENKVPLAYDPRLSRLEDNLQRLRAAEVSGQASFGAGSRHVLKRNYLLGQQQGLLDLGRAGFECIREAIMGMYPATIGRSDWRREKPFRIAHIVHPVIVSPHSDLRVAQPITFATMNTAREFVRTAVQVELFAVQYHNEDRVSLPDSFIRTPDLARSVLDVGKFLKTRKLALIKDILDALHGATDADYLIYTNADIALQPYFYQTVAALIAQGHDAFIINRRTISGRYRRLEDIPLMYAELGEKHPGWDCFVFARRLYPKFRLGNACIGTDWIGRMMISNMATLAKRFEIFKDLHATFHIGDDRAWTAGEFRDYAEHNKSECRKTLWEFDRLYGPFDHKTLPGKFLTKFTGDV